jgi:hypothetical protein
MAKWVWSCRVLKILPPITSSSGDVLEAKGYCCWQWVRFIAPRLFTRVRSLYIGNQQNILSSDRASCNRFNLSVSFVLIKASVREKPA